MTIREEKRALYLLIANAIHEHQEIESHEAEAWIESVEGQHEACQLCQQIKEYREKLAELESQPNK